MQGRSNVCHTSCASYRSLNSCFVGMFLAFHMQGRIEQDRIQPIVTVETGRWILVQYDPFHSGKQFLIELAGMLMVGNMFIQGLVNGYGIAGAIFFLVMFMLHGSLWLAIKSQGELQTRAVASATLLWPVMLILLVAFLVLTFFNTDLFNNYWSNPLLLLLPVVALAGLLGVRCMLRRGQLWKAWMCSAVYIIGVTFFGVMGMFPRMLISSIDPTATLTAFNASSSELTLKIMLGVALVMVPIVLLYQFWVYRLFSHSLSAEDLKDEHAY